MRKNGILLIIMILTVWLAACGADRDTLNGESEDSYDAGEGAADDAGEDTADDAWSSTAESEAAGTAAASDTVAGAAVDAHSRQTFYLWEEGNMPSQTEYTENDGRYADDPDFRPAVRTFPAPEGTEIKGAVLICAGGAFQYRSDENEGTPVAELLSSLGYQSFVVDYRLRPYTQEEGALDLARAVRFVRSHAEEYGIDEKDIAVMGFSAGGILSGEMLLHFDGLTDGTSLDAGYVPDELDQVSADAAACGMIYAFYGRLSVASTDVESFREADLPPTYFVYGSRDPFVGEFEECVRALQEAGIPVEAHELEDMPHGFGAEGGWIDGYDAWLSQIFAENGGQNRLGDETVAGESVYTLNTKVADVINDPVFDDYGRLIFPVDLRISGGLELRDLDSVLMWYNNVNPEKTVEIANYLREQAASGEQIFYDIYTEEEKEADPDKEDTGLFFFRGDPGARTAVLNAGGGFVYVAAMHDSFPQALELSQNGYNAFALIYRPGAQTACEDLARAIAFLHENAEELRINMTDYSLWGGSAGARMAAWLGSYGTAAFGEEAYPRPAAVIMQYTGLSEVTGYEPPTYACVGTSDGIAYYRTVENYISQIQQDGTDAEVEVFNGLRHGFGLGQGTVAEGWIDRAISFWERNMGSYGR